MSFPDNYATPSAENIAHFRLFLSSDPTTQIRVDKDGYITEVARSTLSEKVKTESSTVPESLNFKSSAKPKTLGGKRKRPAEQDQPGGRVKSTPANGSGSAASASADNETASTTSDVEILTTTAESQSKQHAADPVASTASAAASDGSIPATAAAVTSAAQSTGLLPIPPTTQEDAKIARDAIVAEQNAQATAAAPQVLQSPVLIELVRLREMNLALQQLKLNALQKRNEAMIKDPYMMLSKWLPGHPMDLWFQAAILEQQVAEQHAVLRTEITKLLMPNSVLVQEPSAALKHAVSTELMAMLQG